MMEESNLIRIGIADARICASLELEQSSRLTILNRSSDASRLTAKICRISPASMTKELDSSFPYHTKFDSASAIEPPLPVVNKPKPRME